MVLFDILCVVAIIAVIVAIVMMVYFGLRLSRVVGVLISGYVPRREYEERHMELQRDLNTLTEKHDRLESYIHQAVHDIRDSLNTIIPSVKVIMLKVVGVEMPNRDKDLAPVKVQEKKADV